MGIKKMVNSLGKRTPVVSEVYQERNQLRIERKELKKENTRLAKQLVKAEEKLRKSKSTLEEYVTVPPTPDVPFRIFEGAWTSNVPGIGFGALRLFQDPKMDWYLEQCGGVTGKSVLELGPLEGGHTYMLAKAGAGKITSIEANSTAFLKCLIVQNALKFNADFMLGDFKPYLESCTETYDLVMASGVLYHMAEPVKLLQDIARVSKAIAFWTHYNDADVILSRPELTPKFESVPRVEEIGGRKIELYKQSYLDSLYWQGFCGGPAPYSYWMTKEGILGLLGDLGFETVIKEDDRGHRYGPAITFFARR